MGNGTHFSFLISHYIFLISHYIFLISHFSICLTLESCLFQLLVPQHLRTPPPLLLRVSILIPVMMTSLHLPSLHLLRCGVQLYAHFVTSRIGVVSGGTWSLSMLISSTPRQCRTP